MCESKVEIVTPYWASNSNGKVNINEVFVLIMFFVYEVYEVVVLVITGLHSQVRAIMNNKEFEQAIHQEICT